MLVALDLKTLKPALITLGSTVLAGMIAVFGTSSLLTDQKRLNNRHQAQLKAVRDKYTSLAQEVEHVNMFMPRFQAFVARGLIGKPSQETLQQWYDQVKNLGVTKDLPPFPYTLQPSAPIVPVFPFTFGGYKLYGATMDLPNAGASLSLLHEGDLVRMLEELLSKPNGLNTVLNCGMERNVSNKPVNPYSSEPNLKMTCKLVWYTVDGNDASWNKKGS